MLLVLYLIVADGTHAVVSRDVALQEARNAGLDLVEVAPQSQPPVCKLLDAQAEKEKKEVLMRERQESKRSVRSRRKHEEKEMRFSARTAENDMQMKLSKARSLLQAGNTVKLTVRFKKGERLGKTRKELGTELLGYIENQLSSIATRIREPSMKGPFMSMQVAPNSSGNDDKPKQ